MSNLIVFDLDGVITSEAAYWDAAGLALGEVMYSPYYWNLAGGNPGAAHVALQSTAPYHAPTKAAASRSLSRAIFPEPEIQALKARAINSNWDTTYAAVCLRLVDLLARLPAASLFPLRPWDTRWIAAFRETLASDSQDVLQKARPFSLLAALEAPLLSGYTGMELINRFDAYASERLGRVIQGVFSRYSPFWEFCRDIFQQWFLGDELYARTYGHAPAQPGKPGCIHFEQPLLPLEQTRATLETLRRQGYILGIATGRDRQEAIYPLKQYGLLAYFDEQRISTYDDVERAEAILREKGDQTLLTKPHPFPFLVAAYSVSKTGEALSLPGTRATQAFPPRPESTPAPTVGTAAGSPYSPFVVVGDSTSDVLGGRAAGAITVAVLTGARTVEARERLAQSGPDFTIGNITELPGLLADIDSLATIQRLQFLEREKAERLLRRWFERHMRLAVEDVTLTPKAVSLNSFNGFYRSDGEEFFFKTHVEEQGTLEEYYHAERLSQAGYNIVQPLRTLHEGGRQMVIYPVVRWPVVFDLMRAVETGDAEKSMGVTAEALTAAERAECARLLDIYRSTLQFSTAEEHAQAPVHQLFWHRLAGERLKTFYEGKQIALPAGNGDLPFDALLRCRWRINGALQQHTLGELIEQGKSVLRPERAMMTVVGHGDAHFGNVFLEELQGYLYFDPAFAGRHAPLLDVVKPLFHNIFATWMYFPREVARDVCVTVSLKQGSDGHPERGEGLQDGGICHPERSEGSNAGAREILRCAQDDNIEEGGNAKEGDIIEVKHDFTLTAVRQAILRAKVEHLLRPLVAELAARVALPDDWREIVQLALMCCPLLTINLADGERFPPEISWLGLSLAVQMGNSGISSWGFEL
ncbi:MAG TPA: HAD hydrolase-like protein [Ktedonobacteraceae bacterium]|nr:HAD hydrolase-like protein [Ktedonobacteraceae bacterium]